MSNLNFRSLCILLAAILIANVGTTSAQESKPKLLRWYDVQSRQSVRAYFDSVENGLVKIKTKDGETYSIAIDRLSSANQRYVKNQQSKHQPPTPAPSVDQPNAAAEMDDARPVAQPVAENLIQPKSMYGIRWEPMDDLVTNQPVPATDNKPIFWFRVLGDLEGFM
jgi:hypothetical protein